MIIQGKYNKADIKIDNIDNNTYSQILNLCNQIAFENSILKIMPDCHPSKTCLVGFTATFNDKVCPSVVGGDIGCGMLVCEFKNQQIELLALDKIIREQITERKKIQTIVDKYNNKLQLENLKCKKYVDFERVYESMGTLGGGNHFIGATRS